MPGRGRDADRHLEDLAAELGDARELRRAAGQDDPGRQHARGRPARHLVAQQLERLAHPRLDDLADLEPADGPAGVLAEDRDADLLVLEMPRRSQVPWRTLSSSATWSEVLRPIATSLVTLLPPTGSTGVWNGEPSTNSARSIVPAPMSATATPSSFSVSVRTASEEASDVDDQLVDLDAGRGDALGQVLDRGRGRRDDVRLDLEPQGAHPERVLDALLAVDREAAPLDVEHLAVGGDRDGAGDLDRAADVLAGDLAVVRR